LIFGICYLTVVLNFLSNGNLTGMGLFRNEILYRSNKK
jgi:hypothetical protein